MTKFPIHAVAVEGDEPSPPVQPIARPAPAEADSPSTRQAQAAVQVRLPDALAVSCPTCGTERDRLTTSVVLSLGPFEEGVQLFAIQADAGMPQVVEELRRFLIGKALERTGGNKARAAKLLKVKYTTFHSMLQRLGIE